MVPAKMASAIDVRIDDVGSILKVRIGVPLERILLGFASPSVASGVDTEFPYWVRIIDKGVDCRDPLCRHHFRSQEIRGEGASAKPAFYETRHSLPEGLREKN